MARVYMSARPSPLASTIRLVSFLSHSLLLPCFSSSPFSQLSLVRERACAEGQKGGGRSRRTGPPPLPHFFSLQRGNVRGHALICCIPISESSKFLIRWQPLRRERVGMQCSNWSPTGAREVPRGPQQDAKGAPRRQKAAKRPCEDGPKWLQNVQTMADKSEGASQTSPVGSRDGVSRVSHGQLIDRSVP